MKLRKNRIGSSQNLNTSKKILKNKTGREWKRMSFEDSELRLIAYLPKPEFRKLIKNFLFSLSLIFHGNFQNVIFKYFFEFD